MPAPRRAAPHPETACERAGVLLRVGREARRLAGAPRAARDDERERERLAEAGLDVATLEAAGRLLIVEFDAAETPEDSTLRWQRGLEEALSDGYTALWYSRFPVGRDRDQYARVLRYEQAWDACFRDRPVVTLCPYIVGELTAGEALTRVAELHSGVLLDGHRRTLSQLKRV